MPNHVDNKMILEGPKEVLDEFERISFAGYEIKPGDAEAAKKRSVSLMEPEHIRKGEFSFGALTGIPDDYADNWYDRAIELWGTKWDAYDISHLRESDTRFEVCFNSAWSPPEEYYRAVAARFPTLRMKVIFLDEMSNFVGYAAAMYGRYASDFLDESLLVDSEPPTQLMGENADLFAARYEEWEMAWPERRSEAIDKLGEMAEEVVNSVPFQVTG